VGGWARSPGEISSTSGTAVGATAAGSTPQSCRTPAPHLDGGGNCDGLGWQCDQHEQGQAAEAVHKHDNPEDQHACRPVKAHLHVDPGGGQRTPGQHMTTRQPQCRERRTGWCLQAGTRGNRSAAMLQPCAGDT
jgi:hypothetical protein